MLDYIHVTIFFIEVFFIEILNSSVVFIILLEGNISSELELLIYNISKNINLMLSISQNSHHIELLEI